jgi:hypothetical protein
MANKVVALLEKGQHPLHRVLLIGGVTRNTALLEALRGKLSGIELVVLPESAWFEAWGTALLTRERPLHNGLAISSPDRLTVPSSVPSQSDHRRGCRGPARLQGHRRKAMAEPSPTP